MSLTQTNFHFPGQKGFYKGKVRDVYNINDELLIMVVTDRISAFDVVLKEGIPHKGQVLNQIASYLLDATQHIVPNWKLATPDPMVTVGYLCAPFKVEMVIRGYLTGHAWRLYRQGIREICGVPMPDGMKENQPFPQPLITPTTKADKGHDQDISREEIIRQHIVSEKEYTLLEDYTRQLFRAGTKMAADKGLILVDTKYEFGKKNDQIVLLDEIHTPDSSRYFYSQDYATAFSGNLPQKQLSKEFVRQWLMDKGFSGKEGQLIPEMDAKTIHQISERYIALYEMLTEKEFHRYSQHNLPDRIEENIKVFLQKPTY